MNGYDFSNACAVTMNGLSYIFRAVKQSSPYGQKYVVLLGRAQRSGRHKTETSVEPLFLIQMQGNWYFIRK